LKSQAFPIMAKIYVASSWRNQHYESVVNRLRMAGHEVYDFRNPPKGTGGFHWSDVDSDYMNWNVTQYREGLKSPKAEQQFANDIEALTWADTCLLVLPCGRSAHTEAGWMAGAGKKVIVYIPEMQEAELMYKLFDLVTDDIGEVLTFLQEPGREFLHMWPEYGEALFWDLKGVSCGDFTRIYLDNDIEIDLTGINGLKEWFREWDSESLYHKKGWTDSEWKEWWNRGYELAKQIKKLLPYYVDFYYMWKTEDIWKIRPKDADDGGVFAWNIPLPI
jgi:hypothetical protein